MQKGHQNFFFLFCLASLLFFSLYEVESQSDFSYIIGNQNGPDYWGQIDPEWRACGEGSRQSPINIQSQGLPVVPSSGQLRKLYQPSPARLINTGHYIELEWKGDAGSVIVNGEKFKLAQCHWHTPSEHTVNGERFEMEMHVVHRTDAGKIIVIAKTFREGAQPDPFLAQVISLMSNIAPGEEVEAGIVDPNNIVFNLSQYYRYTGSLTTPPCTEGVIWTVGSEVLTASREQVEALSRAIEDGDVGNSRPRQELNGRLVQLYAPPPFSFSSTSHSR